MKIRESKNGNVKLSLSEHEVDVVMSILSHVRLGVSANSDVVFELLERLDALGNEPSVEVAFEYNESEGHVLNV